MEIRNELRNSKIHAYHIAYVFFLPCTNHLLMVFQEGLLRTKADRVDNRDASQLPVVLNLLELLSIFAQMIYLDVFHARVLRRPSLSIWLLAMFNYFTLFCLN